MDRQQQQDLVFVLDALMNCAGRDALLAWLEECNNTEEQLDAAMKRLGKVAGFDAGLL